MFRKQSIIDNQYKAVHKLQIIFDNADKHACKRISSINTHANQDQSPQNKT